ncbi:MAG: ComEC/Rec2 family competence protein [Candidatus Omnitrophica bacterium]|nr:ComEC/Rec2 family competence protein [Candidatus Omnitrophota bacterium]
MTHRPAVWILLAFTGGVVSGNVLGVPALLGLLVIFPFFMLAARRSRRWLIPLGLAFVFFIGAFDAWDAGLLPLNHIAQRLDDFKGRSCAVVCRVASSPRWQLNGLSPKKMFLCDIETINDEVWQGRVQVHLYCGGDVAYGDRLRVTGKIARPYDPAPGGRNSYSAYLKRQGVYAFLHVRKNALREALPVNASPSLEAVALSCREYLQGIFRKYLSPGEAGLMNAMLLGPRDDIPPYVYDVFRKTGTAHIIAISGMNMTLTAVGLMLILGMFNMPRGVRAWVAVAILGFYSLMAGNGPPVARSAIMAVAVILSFVIERESDAMNGLALAGLILLAIDPRQFHDVGLQLSFVCVASLILLAPLILKPLEDVPWCQTPWVWSLIESGAVTLAAFIGSAGILAYDFGYLSPIGLIVNLPVIPLMAIVTALGFLVLAFGLLLPFMAVPFALCLKAVLNVCVAVLGAASRVPVIRCDGMNGFEMLLYYLILAGGIFFFYYRQRFHSRAFIDKPLPL